MSKSVLSQALWAYTVFQRTSFPQRLQIAIYNTFRISSGDENSFESGFMYE